MHVHAGWEWDGGAKHADDLAQQLASDLSLYQLVACSSCLIRLACMHVLRAGGGAWRHLQLYQSPQHTMQEWT